MTARLVCAKGHEWEAHADALASMTQTCPVCGDPSGTSLAGALPPPPAAEDADRTLTAPTALHHRSLPEIQGYVILREIAHGGMGVVYHAQQVLPPREVALKMILSGAMAGPDDLARFFKEGAALAKLDHPNIVPIHEFGNYQGQPFFTQEYLSGGTLAEKLAGHPTPPEEAARTVVTLARAIHAAHEQQIIHRDLSPHNVLFSATGAPKITDFGLAKQLGEIGEQTQSGAVMGKPSYMAPEQAAGKLQEISPATDVYALGAILYEMLTGRPPFRAPSVVETLDQVRHHDPVAPSKLQPKVPRGLEIICLKCLRKEVGKRYPTAAELADDLERFLRGEPIHATPIPPWERLWLWARRRPAAAGLWGLSTVALIAIVISFLAYRANLRETTNATRAKALVEAIESAEPTALPRLLDELKEYRRWANPILREKNAAGAANGPARLRLRLALVPIDPEQVALLKHDLLECKAEEFGVVRDALKLYQAELSTEYWRIFESRTEPRSRRLRAAAALAAYEPDHEGWNNADLAGEAIDFLLQENSLVIGYWTEGFRPVRRSLTEPLAKIFGDGKRPDVDRSLAADLLAEYDADRPEVLANLVPLGSARQAVALLARLQNSKGELVARKMLAEVMESPLPEHAADRQRDERASRHAKAAVALLRLGNAEVLWPLLRFNADTRLRSRIIHYLPLFDVDPNLLFARLRLEADDGARRALILSLAGFDIKALRSCGDALPAELRRLLREDSDAGVHSACEWILEHRFGIMPDAIGLVRVPAVPQTEKVEWFTSGNNGHTFAAFPPPLDFHLGSPKSETGHYKTEERAAVRIPRAFAVATRETTFAQYLRFLEETGGDAKKLEYTPRHASLPHGPVIAIRWFEAVRYCRWLSEKDKVPPSEMCYPPMEQIKPGMMLDSGFLRKTGYRLPTEAEWEYACRGGVQTSRPFGSDEALLPTFSRFVLNSEFHTWPVGSRFPNDFGLFDMLGNSIEWCQTPFRDRYPLGAAKGPWVDDEDETEPIPESSLRCLRGGSFLTPPGDTRCATRGRNQANLYFDTVGFRIARTLK